jgi:hypothetical protein
MAPRIVRLLLENSPPVDDGVTEKPGFNELETFIRWQRLNAHGVAHSRQSKEDWLGLPA